MSLDPTLLVRRWPERRAVVLAAAAGGFAAVLAAVAVTGDAGLSALSVLPVTLAALELGLAGGLVAAAAAVAATLLAGAAGPALAVVAVGAIAGRFSDRMRAVHAREQRLLESGLVIGALPSTAELPAALAAAALRTPGVTGARVEIDGAPPATAGRMEGRRSETPVLARGARLGRLAVAHRAPLGPEDRAALELLALQAGLAADNLRLLGAGRLLDDQEGDRRRMAETLHEELAQTLAAVLMGLRVLGREAVDREPVDELHGQVVGVLESVRHLAGELRPSTLAALGLVPALEALDGVAVQADGLPDELPEPLRTGVYRLVEEIAPARVRLSASHDRLGVDIDGPLGGSVAAAHARAALLGGSLRLAGPSRLHVELPLQAETAGSTARTTVLPADDSTSSSPCASATRSRIPTRPNPATRASGSKPRPSSSTSTRTTS
jgi:signal transduction histidine kinase